MTERDVLFEMLKLDFRMLVKFVFKEYYGDEFTFYEFHVKLATILTTLRKGSRSIINAPPRIGKTVLIQLLCVWLIIRNPRATIIYVSYNERLAAAKNNDIRQILAWISSYFGKQELALDRTFKGKNHWMNLSGGSVMARGSNNDITGFGADTLLVVDDPNKPEDRSSEVMLERRNRVFYTTIRNRINSPDVPILIVQQRVAVTDLSGFLLRGNIGEEWDHYNFPAILENGNALCPERLPLDEIEKYRSDPFTYNAQYLQNPIDSVGKLFDRNRIVLASSRPSTASMRLVISVDASSKDKVKSDYNAIAVIGFTGRDYYVLDVINIRSDINVLLDRIRECRKRWGANVPIVFESKANGCAAAQLLRKEMNGILEVNPTKDKVERAILVKHLFDSMNVFFSVRGLVWGTIVAQFTQFPHVKNDDIVDAVVQGISWLQMGAGIRQPEQRRVDYGRPKLGGNRVPTSRDCARGAC